MQNNNKDNTLKKNYLQKYQFLIEEYEEVKARKHGIYKFVKDFYSAHGTCPQTFIKYYNRYKQSNENAEYLLPQKRGPKYLTRRTPAEIENIVLKVRQKGCNKYEIHDILKNDLGDKTPSASCIYKILKRNNMNKLNKVPKEEKQRIMKEYAGQLGHVDNHHLSKDLIANDSKRYYLTCVIDDQSRIAWAEVIEDIKSITVMFAVLRCMNMIKRTYNIQFEEILTDNGPEFGTKISQNKTYHPFERLLIEMGIKHRYTRPYRPQTNGKVERFWRTLNDDLIDGTYFESLEHFKEELEKYLAYYNELRPHQGLNSKRPKEIICLKNE